MLKTLALVLLLTACDKPKPNLAPEDAGIELTQAEKVQLHNNYMILYKEIEMARFMFHNGASRAEVCFQIDLIMGMLARMPELPERAEYYQTFSNARRKDCR